MARGFRIGRGAIRRPDPRGQEGGARAGRDRRVRPEKSDPGEREPSWGLLRDREGCRWRLEVLLQDEPR